MPPTRPMPMSAQIARGRSTVQIDRDKFEQLLLNIRIELQTLEDYLNRPGDCYKEPVPDVRLLHEVESLKPQLPHVVQGKTSAGPPPPASHGEGESLEDATDARVSQAAAEILGQTLADQPTALPVDVSRVYSLNPKHAILSPTNFKTLLPKIRLHRKPCMNPTCTGITGAGDCAMCDGELIRTIDLGLFPYEIGCDWDDKLARVVRTFYSRERRLEFLTNGKKHQNLMYVRRHSSGTANQLSNDEPLLHNERSDLQFPDIVCCHSDDFPIVVRWIWADKDMLHAPDRWISFFWKPLPYHWRNRLWFYWVGLTRNEALKEAVRGLSAHVHNLSADIHALNEEEVYVSGAEHLLSKGDVPGALRDLLVLLINLDSIIDCQVPIQKECVRTHNLMDMAGMPYDAFARFYFTQRELAFSAVLHSKDNDLLVVKRTVSQCLVRSIRYFELICKDLNAAVNRNDGLFFKVLLFVINVISFITTLAYEYFFPPVWKEQIQDLADHGIACNSPNLTAV